MRWTGSAARRLRQGLSRLPTGIKDVATPPATVSVVVTVSDDQRELLEACLHSLDQTGYEHLDIHVVAHGREAQHATLGEARNAALERANGEYLIFLEASETLTHDGLTALVERLESSGSAFAVGGRDQEGDGAGVRHPDRTAIRISDRPETVGDTSWGNKLFRRSLWDQTFPAAGSSGLGSQAVRAYVEAEAFDLVPQVVSEAADPAAGLPFGHFLTVMDGVHAWGDSLASTDRLLAVPDLGAVRRAWLVSLLAGEALRFVDDVEAATPEQWTTLRNALPPLVGEAGPGGLADLAWESRVKYWLLTHARREDLENFLHLRRWEGPSHPTVTSDGRVHATVWPHRDPLLDVPDRVFELTERESPLVASLRMVRWLDAETLELDLFAFVRLVEDGPMPPMLEAALVDGEGRRVDLAVERAPNPEVTRFAAERFHVHDQGGFRVRIDAGQVLGSPRWRLQLTLTSNGVTRSGTVNDREHNGVLGTRPRRLASGKLWGPSAVGPDGMVIEVSAPAFVLSDVAVEGRTVRGTLLPADDGGAHPRSVLLSRKGEEVSAEVDAAGRFEATLPEVTGHLDDPEWRVRAVARDGQWHPVAYPAEADGPWLGDEAGALAWRRSQAGQAAVHEVAHRPVVSDVGLVRGEAGDEAVVRLSWLGAVPTSWSLSLVSPRVALRPAAVETQGRESTVRIPLRADEWGLGEIPAPAGFYSLELVVGEDRTEAVGTAEDLVIRTPLEACGDQVRVRWRQTPKHRLTVQITPPKADDELGPTQLRRLQEEYRATSYTLDPHAVYLQAYTGHAPTDSALAIHEHLHRHYPHLTLYWGVSDYSVHLPEGAVPVLMRTREWFDVLGRATYLVNNIDFDKWFVKQPGQRFLQTFHGYPAKSMGLVQWRAKRFPERKIEGELDRTMRKWDLILTPAPEMDEYYRREYGYDGPILNQGYPRDDVLVSPGADEVRRTTRERLGIRPEQKVVLYAPTFRDHLATDHRSVRLASHLDLETASEALGEEYVLLMRGHRFHSRGAQRMGRGRRLVDVTDYPEVNDLILAADAAVLDYSSLRFDFALTRKPMVFLVPDLDVYSGPVRGFLYDYPSTAPGPLLSDAAEVVEALGDLDGLAEHHAGQIDAFLATYQRWQDGHATERVVRAFFGPPPGEPA